MRLGIGRGKMLNWKLLLAVVAVIGMGGLVAAIALLRGDQPSDKTRLVTASAYTGTGTYSAQRVDVNLQPGAMDQQLPPDAIPPIYQPASMFIPWNEANINNQSYVMGLVINGEAKAYPVEVLNFREMVNDVVGGIPVLVTW